MAVAASERPIPSSLRLKLSFNSIAYIIPLHHCNSRSPYAH